MMWKLIPWVCRRQVYVDSLQLVSVSDFAKNKEEKNTGLGWGMCPTTAAEYAEVSSLQSLNK